jgi:hypothetical protein
VDARWDVTVPQQLDGPLAANTGTTVTATKITPKIKLRTIMRFERLFLIVNMVILYL